MIQRSDDLLNANSSTFSAATSTQGNSSMKAAPIPKLNLKVKLQLHEDFNEGTTTHLFDSAKIF